MSSKGLFVVLEGIDGSGKTTLSNLLKNDLESNGYTVYSTAEPTNGPIGALLRKEKIDSPRAEALLFVADRAYHTEEMLKRVENGEIVICDRYYASTLAYQSTSFSSSAFDMAFLTDLNEAVVSEPDITFLLDLDPEVSAGRIDTRGEQKSKFERLEFQKQVRDNYLRIAGERGFCVLDASSPSEQVCAEALKQIYDRLR